MEFLIQHHLLGIIIGFCTFFIIGLFHPLVRKAEYHWGKKSWIWFLLGGILAAVGAVLTSNILLSAFLGVFAFASFWGIHEVFEQVERVKKGWAKMNPKRQAYYAKK